jgi:transglutaminase-like putative cysteine protease
MKLEYKNPEKRKGIFIWEMVVNFLSKEKYFGIRNVNENEMKESAKKMFGDDALCFLSVNQPDKFLFWIAKIKEWDNQKVTYLDYSIKDQKEYEDVENGNLILFYDFSKNILGEKNLKVNFTIDFYETELVVDSWETKEYDKSSSFFKRYTKSERQLAQADSIVSTARRITRDGAGYYAKAKMVYNWIEENITYKESTTKRGAIRIFESKEGNAAEMSFLCITLMRAAGIPSRLVSGAWGEIEKKQDAHFWLEFYLQDVGWVPVDCSKKMFGKIDNKRTIFSKGENILLNRGPENSDFFNINYGRTFFMQPEAVYVNKQEGGVFAIKQSKYLLIKG